VAPISIEEIDKIIETELRIDFDDIDRIICDEIGEWIVTHRNPGKFTGGDPFSAANWKPFPDIGLFSKHSRNAQIFFDALSAGEPVKCSLCNGDIKTREKLVVKDGRPYHISCSVVYDASKDSMETGGF